MEKSYRYEHDSLNTTCDTYIVSDRKPVMLRKNERLKQNHSDTIAISICLSHCIYE